jgi:hypothetical protein
MATKLTPEQQEFFSKMETTFLTGGWDLLSRGWKEERDALPAAMFFGAKTFEDLVEGRIRYQLLSELSALPETIAKQRETILDPEDTEEEPFV